MADITGRHACTGTPLIGIMNRPVGTRWASQIPALVVLVAMLVAVAACRPTTMEQRTVGDFERVPHRVLFLGMSVRWHDARVENLDDSTLRLVWSGWPRDEEVAMSISKVGDGYRVLLTQAAPYPNTDAVGYDRILVLTFDSPISADAVKVTFKDVAI